MIRNEEQKNRSKIKYQLLFTPTINKISLAAVFVLVVIAAPLVVLPRAALADIQGTSVAGKGVQCTNDNMGMSNMPSRSSSHDGYRLDYQASGMQPTSGTSGHGRNLSMVLSDSGTNQTIKFVTYVVRIDRVNETTSNSTGGPSAVDSVLGSNVFLSKDGNLTFNLKPAADLSTTSQPVIYGDQDPLLNAYVSDPGSILTIDSLRMVRGSYHASVELFGVDTAQCIFSGSSVPKFDIYWTLGNGGSVTPMSSTAVPEFDMSQGIILLMSLSALVGTGIILRNKKIV